VLSKPTTVINIRAGQKYDVYIGRGSMWGNPYSHLTGTKALYVVRNRDAAIQAYLDYLIDQPQLMEALHTLRGKVLGCYCKPLSCHGDLLAVMADEL